MTRLIIVVLTLVNFALLVPGVTLPIYSVEITTEVEAAIIADFLVGGTTSQAGDALRRLFDGL